LRNGFSAGVPLDAERRPFMPVTRYMADPNDPVTQFMRTRFPGAAAIMRPVRKELMALPAACPPAAGPGYYPYMTIGKAIDFRIRYYFAVTPLTDYAGYRASLNTRLGPYAFTEFFYDFEIFLDQLQPAGRRLMAADEEMLARYCYILGLFDHSGRGQPLHPDLIRNRDDLLSLVERPWVDDLCALSWAFYDAGLLPLNAPAVLNPNFMGSRYAGGPEADLISDGCLIEIKTSLPPHGLKQALGPKTLFQLLRYALLDYNDAYGIHAFGIYLTRQSCLLRWELAELLPAICGVQPAPTLAALRADFQALLAPAARPSPRRKPATRP
jgi:hypothetical protein